MNDRMGLTIMLRVAFRALVALTLITMMLARMSGGKLPAAVFVAFHYWFVLSVAVFAAFGVRAVMLARRDPRNRRAYMFDIVLALVWIPYWYMNLN